jgi:hypothetical protein
MKVMAKSTSLRLISGTVTPDIKTIRAVMKSLRTRIRRDKTLAARYKSNPKVVLGELGLNKIIQLQILQEDGRRVRAGAEEQRLMLGCAGCTGCCCTGCCVTSL